MASTSSFRASSSIPQTSYDVFLSFRGEDTRNNFTDHLHNALLNRGIRTFRDDKLKRGEAIAPELLKSIEESRSSIIVFSENYAHSKWCLDELVKIMECKKYLGHTVFPIFYHVDPSDVRKQTGSFGAAFAGYEENWKDKIQRWRTALTEAANLSGWHLLDGYEYDHIKKITESIFRTLNCMRFDVGANLVGIDSRVNEMILRLHMEFNDVRIVGIYGVGGIGKTTLAKQIYNKLSYEFECTRFLENIREVSNTQVLSHLGNQLLGDIPKGKRVFIVLDDVDDLEQLECLLINRGCLGEGSRVIITTRNKHLLTVQEVDNSYEVKELNFEEAYELFSLYAFKHNLPKSDFINLSEHAVCYCQGHPLALKVVGSLLFNKTIPQWESELHKLNREPEAKIYNVLKRSYDGLDRTEKNIFLDVACFFKGEARDCVSRILDCCNFYAERGIKNLNDKCLINVQDKWIHMHHLIQQMGWEIVREKFPNEPDKWSRLWDPHDIERAFKTNKGIKGVETISLDLSKLKRTCFNSNVFTKMTRLRLLKVHFGWPFNECDTDYNIEEEEYLRGFCWFFNICDTHYDIEKEKEEEEEEEQEEMLMKDVSKMSESFKEIFMKDVSKMPLSLDFEFPSYELRYFHWDGYPIDSLPSNFDGENLVELRLIHSNIKQLWQGNKILERLKIIDLSSSRKLIEMPEFSSMPNLERLILRHCESLIDIHPSVGVLKKLTTLNLRWCSKLKGLPSSISNLESLEILDLSNCSSFEKFPKIQGSMRSLRHLFLRRTTIRELPSGINLESIEKLDLFCCSKFRRFPKNGANMKNLRKLSLGYTAIKKLPVGIAKWKSLPILDLSRCSKFEKFSEKEGNMKSLMKIYLQYTAIKDLPDSIGDLESLEILNLSNCSKFEKFPEKGGNMKSLRKLCLQNTAIKDLPDSIGDLESLNILYLSYCSKFEKFPEKGGNMKSLRELCLKNTAIKDFPDSIGDLESLEILDLSHCSMFEKFPQKGGNMKSLRKLCLQNTAIKDLPDSIEDLESLDILDLSYCSKFEKFPEKGGNMKSLRELCLKNTAIKDLPDSFGDLESLEILDLSYCSKFEKFPEMARSMNHLCGNNQSGFCRLDIRECKNLRNLPTWKFLNCLILDSCSELLEGSIRNQVWNLGKLNTSHCKMDGQILELPSSLAEIHAHDWISKEDLSSLVRLCHLNWLKSTTEELKCWKLRAAVPESSGIPLWITHQELGTKVTTDLPTNWYENPDVLGFIVSCVYQRPIPTSHDHVSTCPITHFICNLNLHGNGFRFSDLCSLACLGDDSNNFYGLANQVWVWWYPKIAIQKKHHPHKFTHLSASFGECNCNVKKCGVNLIFAGGQHKKHVPMLLDVVGNFGGNGLVVHEESNRNCKRKRDDSLTHAAGGPQYKRFGAPNTISRFELPSTPT